METRVLLIVSTWLGSKAKCMGPGLAQPSRTGRRICQLARVGVFACCAAMAACGPQSVRAQQSEPAQWVIPHLQVGYTPPPGYRIRSKEARDGAQFVGPQTNGFPASITIDTVLTKGHSLEATVKHVLGILGQGHPEMKVSGVRPSHIGTDESFQADFRQTQASRSGTPQDIETRMILITHEDRAFSFLLSADPAAFDRGAAALEKSLDTVNWAVRTPAEPLNLSDVGMSAIIPENWCLVQQDPGEDSPFALTVIGPYVDEYRSTISLLLADAGSATLPDDAAQTLAAVRQTPEHYRMISQKRLLIDKFPAVAIDGAFEDPNTHKPGLDRVILLVRHGKMYSFRLSTSPSGFDVSARAAFMSFVTSIHWAQNGPAAPASQP